MKSISLLFLYITASAAFLVPQRQGYPFRYATLSLHAKQKKKNNSSGSKGFGKVESPKKPEARAPPSAVGTPSSAAGAPAGSSPFLQSVESGGSDAIPFVSSASDDSSLSPEERTQKVLREQYGMKTLEEQKLDAKQLENLQEQRRKSAEWRRKANEGEDFDIMAMIPGPVVIALDRFLKLGLAVVSFLFILAGLGITLEAWSKSSGSPLPENIDAFIAETIEPNFTTGLFVLLGFSISLGLLATAQLGSTGSLYKEDE